MESDLMRLICPNCDAEYEIDAALVPKLGRDVECSACGQVWFQAGSPEILPESTGLAEPLLSRPLSPSVLSILREEAEFERRARQADRSPEAGTPQDAPLGRKDVTEAEKDAVADPAEDVAATFVEADEPLTEAATQPLDLPMIDWPATTVSEFDPTGPAGYGEYARPVADMPPLVLPDAEKLAATLSARHQRPQVPPSAEQTPVPSLVTESSVGSPLVDEHFALPGDAAPAAVSDDFLAETAPILPPEGELFLAEPQILGSSYTDENAPSTTTATHIASAPLYEPVVAASAEDGAPERTPGTKPETAPQEKARLQLPATIAAEAASERAGYRGGFGLAIMLALAAVALYFLAPRLAGQGEFGATLMEWRQEADQGRIWLRDQAQELLGSNGPDESPDSNHLN